MENTETCFVRMPFSLMIDPHRPIGGLVGLFRVGNKTTPEGIFQQMVRFYCDQRRAFLKCNPSETLYEDWSAAIGKSMYADMEKFAIEHNESIEAAYDIITRAIYYRPVNTRTPEQQGLYEMMHSLIFKDLIYRTFKDKFIASCRRKHKKTIRIYAAKK